MLKGKLKGGDKDVVVLGLSDENIKRLKSGSPIFFEGDGLGMEDVDFLIMHGQTEQDIEKELREHILTKTED